jgi:hypothetical protein
MSRLMEMTFWSNGALLSITRAAELKNVFASRSRLAAGREFS